jgi:NAD(P)H-flavin reductase
LERQALARAVLEATWSETPGLQAFALKTTELSRCYEVPGQYVRVTLAPDVSAFLAIANAPGTPYLELLVNSQTRVGTVLAALGVGASVEVSHPMGAGFPLRNGVGRDLLLLACGSAMAPMRACIQYVLARRADYGSVRLYYGTREPCFAYGHEHHYWSTKGVELVRVVSSATAHWPGLRGHVQQALELEPPRLSNAVVYACGMPAMLEGVASVLQRLGVPAGSVFTNA